MLQKIFIVFMVAAIAACGPARTSPKWVYPKVAFEDLSQFFTGSIADSENDLADRLDLGEGACVLVYFAVEASGEVVDPGIGAFSGIGTLKQSLFPDVKARLIASKLNPVSGKAKQISTAKVFSYFEEGTSSETKAKVEKQCSQFI